MRSDAATENSAPAPKPSNLSRRAAMIFPPNPRAAFALFDGSRIVLQRVAYDIDETVAAMRRAGYDEPRLWENLYIGAQIGGRIDKVEIIEREHTK